MTSWLVNASVSLPEWQAVKMIFFAPWTNDVKMGVLQFLFPIAVRLITIHHQTQKKGKYNLNLGRN